jgi:hypothetical protein
MPIPGGSSGRLGCCQTHGARPGDIAGIKDQGLKMGAKGIDQACSSFELGVVRGGFDSGIRWLIVVGVGMPIGFLVVVAAVGGGRGIAVVIVIVRLVLLL